MNVELLFTVWTMCLNLFSSTCVVNMKENTFIYLNTLFVSVEQDTLSFKDEDDVFWVGAIHYSGRFCAEELICFVHFLKHVLKDTKSCWKQILNLNLYIHFLTVIMITHTRPSGFLSGWYFCASLK